MNDKYWENYAKDADSHYNEEFSKYIRDLATSLRCDSILEVGCNAGNDLKLFPASIESHGIDSNKKIIDIAKTRCPRVNFKVGSSSNLPYDDESIDMTFTHGFFNYLDDTLVDAGIKELFRVSKKYIVNCEMLDITDENRKGRDMLDRWKNFKLKIISNVEMHKDIDSEKPVFTLVKKI